MGLEKEIMQQMKVAMKEKDQSKLRGLRAIKSALLLAKTEKAGNNEVSEEREFKILQKLAKQRKDSIEIFSQQNREDLVEKEQDELNVIESFLPQLMSEDEIRTNIHTLIKDVDAQGMKDMGKVMGVASKFFAGKADMGLVSKNVKELLG